MRCCSAPAKLGLMELDGAQAAYDGALRRVMSDLTSTTDLRPSVVVDLRDTEGLHYRFRAEGSSGIHGAGLGWYDDEEPATVRLADLVQEDALEELWGPSWPGCPGHSHPAEPTILDGRATWVCPRSRLALAIIGTLAP